MKKFHVRTLGCSKNDVDSLQIQSNLIDAGYLPVSDISEADYIIINTCGFIQPAVEESIQTILECASYEPEKLIVVGCMVQRYARDLAIEIPEVDLFLGTGQMKYIVNYLESSNKEKIYTDDLNSDQFALQQFKQLHQFDKSYSYVKISEGCDNHCTYCIIPKLRGKLRSREINNIVREVRDIGSLGIKEVIIISQDTVRYGRDLGIKLIDLLKSLDEIDTIDRIRLHYLYPDELDDEILDFIANSKRILPYFDIPMQHASDRILRLMNRSVRYEDLVRIYNKIREKFDNSIIRTTFIVGFPGETEQDFEILKNFVREYPMDAVGVFEYCDEEDAASFKLPNKVDPNIASKRRETIMNIQQSISAKLLSNFVSKKYSAVVDEVYENEVISRIYSQSPEIDGFTIINNDGKVKEGEIVNIEIIESLDYDLRGRII